MGKVKKSKRNKLELEKAEKNIPLDEQILHDPSVREVQRAKLRDQRTTNEEQFVDKDLSRKILAQARKQQTELEDEHGVQTSSSSKKTKQVKLTSKTEDESDSEELEDIDDACEQVEIDEDDENALKLFMKTDAPAIRTLGQIIYEKLNEKKTEVAEQLTDVGSMQLDELPESLVKMYEMVGAVLSRYRSGKVPKALKALPSARNWEQYLAITRPEEWTAAAMYQATRIFTSNLKEKNLQRYLNSVLLPRVRDDIAEYKRISPHIYMALSKCLFKPGAFFRGILLPLCQCGTCTLREATLISSVLAKCSIPMLHSASVIIKIAEMDYNGANSIFLRTLLDKKYALSYHAVDAVVFHFLRFRTEKRELPVLWHQCFLTFVQRYKESISPDQKQALMEILRIHVHESITPEIRRELLNSRSRDEVELVEEQPMAIE